MLKSDKIYYGINIFIIILAICSLFFTFTNRIFISPIICICIIFLPYLLYKKKDIDKLTKVLLITYIFFASSVLLYNIGSLFNFDFYRRDGNFFITFAPLLILSLVIFKCNPKKIMSTFLWVETGVNIISIILFLLFGKTHEYFFLFSAHNAAGGFLITILAFAMVKFVIEKDKKDLIIILVNLFALYLTDSRGSIIGLVIGAICLLVVLKTRFKKFDVFVFSLCMVGILSIGGLIMSVLGDKVLEDDGQNFYMPQAFEGTLVEQGLDLINRSHTIINRLFYLWPRALYLFIDSPIIGNGFGAYNDLPYSLVSVIPNLLTINSPYKFIYSDSHAHNSYLHILAETGIVGFVLVIWLLVIIRRYIFSIEDRTLKYGLFFMFLTIIFSSFTEHRLFTPSQVFPFTILLGLVMCRKNYDKMNKKDLVIINGRFLSQKITGVQRYATEVVKQFDNKQVDALILCPNVDLRNLECTHIQKRKVGKLTGHLWEQITLPLYVLWYMKDYNVKLLNLCNTAPILFPGYVTLHDVGFKTNSRHLDKKFALWYNLITFINIKRYKKIFTVSKFSKKEIIRNYNIKEDRIVVTYNAAEHLNDIVPDTTILKKLNLENKKFYFSLGSKSMHKNHAFIEKLAINNPQKTFIVSGNSNKTFKSVNEKEISNLIYSGYISDEEMLPLYKNCEMFIFPSLYEGFGIPPLEAKMVGCKKILVSDIEVFHEIFGDAVEYVDTLSDGKINLDEIAEPKNTVNILEKYKWSNVAEKILKNI